MSAAATPSKSRPKRSTKPVNYSEND
jgi:hypothetical protein